MGYNEENTTTGWCDAITTSEFSYNSIFQIVLFLL